MVLFGVGAPVPHLVSGGSYYMTLNKRKNKLGTVAHACNPSTLDAEVGRSPCQEIKTILFNIVKPHIY